jgi:hypothetical protein
MVKFYIELQGDGLPNLTTKNPEKNGNSNMYQWEEVKDPVLMVNSFIEYLKEKGVMKK